MYKSLEILQPATFRQLNYLRQVQVVLADQSIRSIEEG